MKCSLGISNFLEEISSLSYSIFFLSDQCKEKKTVEEKNRIGKTRDLFKKIRDTKGTFHAKMGSIKDRNGMELTRRSGKNTQKNYTKRSS